MNNVKYAPHEMRVIEEKRELKLKLNKLEDFLESDLFETLDDLDKNLLSDQFRYMMLYDDILNRRISKFST